MRKRLTRPRTVVRIAAFAVLLAGVPIGAGAADRAPGRGERDIARYQMSTLGAAIDDLIATFGDRYPRGPGYARELARLRPAVESGDAKARAELARLRRRALLDNPLLDFDRLLLVKRRPRKRIDVAMPTNHECNTSLPRGGYDDELGILCPHDPDGPLKTFYRPPGGGYVGEVDLHWDARRLLLTQSDAENWKVWEIGADGTGLRQVSTMPHDVDSFDACYLPNGRIVFGCTASFQSVPCWHGQRRVANLYLMNADGSGVRQLCFDQDHDLHPCVLPNGQVLYNRWDYTGINHIFLRELMVMNPDGTAQRAIYGANSWYPNSLYFARSLPGEAHRLICILSGYHGTNRAGQLVILDISRGWHEAQGIVQRISGRGDPIDPQVLDNLVDHDWPKFLHPYPLSEKYYLVACKPGPREHWGIYLADAFDNLVLLREEKGYALLEPVPMLPTPKPRAVPENVDLKRDDAVVYLHDIYAGEGLKGVPRGTVKRLRVIAYHFGYPNLAGPDVIGRGGPWEVMQILGTVPIEDDGSAVFRVPASTPLAVQPLDQEGRAVQLMRSWFTAMPGEKLSCVGCHETPAEAGAGRFALAARRTPREIEPWRGPPRGFDFAREVQPVLDAHCAGCHDGKDSARPDLRPMDQVAGYRGMRLSDLGVRRLHPELAEKTKGIFPYTPAYEGLLPYLRRVGIEDDVSLLVPGEYHADTSELVQLLRKGHHGVRLDEESWDRLVTWIDLNAPCHGSWTDVFPVPEGLHARRMALRRQCGGPTEDPEAVPSRGPVRIAPADRASLPEPQEIALARWPFDPAEARRRQESAAPVRERVIELADGIRLRLVLIPSGKFVMGSAEGPDDQRPRSVVTIDEPFWMGACEVTNEQFRLFDPSHDPRYYQKRHRRPDDRGVPLDGPRQPAVRASWQQAVAYCAWLSEKTGMRFSLPTEAEWEWACRAGTATPLFFGTPQSDFSRWANTADRWFSAGMIKDGKQISGGLEHLVLEGAHLADRRFADRAVVTAEVGSYEPNPWGLFDMHGNAAEWTLSTYRPYPYDAGDERNDAAPPGRKVVRGGSFFDRPARCTSAYRLSYPAWRRVFNVGFRVVARYDGAGGSK